MVVTLLLVWLMVTLVCLFPYLFVKFGEEEVVRELTGTNKAIAGCSGVYLLMLLLINFVFHKFEFFQGFFVYIFKGSYQLTRKKEKG
jgi:hypothetical protein